MIYGLVLKCGSFFNGTIEISSFKLYLIHIVTFFSLRIITFNIVII